MTRGGAIILAAVAAVAPLDAEAGSTAAIEGRADQIERCLADRPDPTARQGCVGLVADPCMAEPGGETTIGMTECLVREADAWDMVLNRLWPSLMAEAEAADAENAPLPAGMNLAAPTLRDAQRAWIAFRDAECTHAYAAWGLGSIRNPEAALCRRDMTAARVIDFHDRLTRNE